MEFNEALVSKLRERSERFEELTELIGSPEVLADGKRYPALLRERGSLESSAKMFDALEALRQQRAEAVAIIAEGGDEDLVALAQEERYWRLCAWRLTYAALSSGCSHIALIREALVM